MYGYDYLPHYGSSWADSYNYLYNADNFGGKKTFPCDVIGFDIYPLEYRNHPSFEGDPNRIFELYMEALDQIVERNYDLIPVMSFIETQDIRSKRETPGPTPEQLRMEIWLNIVHGVKAINWFHYFEPTPSENLAVMKTFHRRITELTPVVLGTVPERVVSDDAGAKGIRIDTMIRETGDAVWVFAVRLTELNEMGGPAIDVTFTVSDYAGTGSAEVYEESRSVSVSPGGSFTDSFAPCDVHIYKLSK
jgi:hypothetical protein